MYRNIIAHLRLCGEKEIGISPPNPVSRFWALRRLLGSALFCPVSVQKGRAAEAARPLFLLSAVSVAARAASAAGAADAASALLFGAVNCVARAAQDGGDDQNDDQIHNACFLSFGVYSSHKNSPILNE